MEIECTCRYMLRGELSSRCSVKEYVVTRKTLLPRDHFAIYSFQADMISSSLDATQHKHTCASEAELANQRWWELV